MISSAPILFNKIKKAWVYGRVTERGSDVCDACSDLVDFRESRLK